MYITNFAQIIVNNLMDVFQEYIDILEKKPYVEDIPCPVKVVYMSLDGTAFVTFNTQYEDDDFTTVHIKNGKIIYGGLEFDKKKAIKFPNNGNDHWFEDVTINDTEKRFFDDNNHFEALIVLYHEFDV